MSCTNPMLAKRNLKTGEVTFVGAVSRFTPQRIAALQNTIPGYQFFKLPCGQCISCRLKKSQEWAVRIMHEAQTNGTACFLTLTFDENKLVDYFHNIKKKSFKKSKLLAKQLLWTLDIKIFQDFMKRLRKEVSPIKVRFFHCGEYGSKKSRPHHHAIIFGYDFPDKKVHCYNKLQNGQIVNYYTSKQLDNLWKLGYCMISDCTENSAGYVARYVTKKVNGSLSDEFYNGRKKEYITMSRRPGIGFDWYKKYGMTDAFAHDYLLNSKGQKVGIPRYYDKLLEFDCPEELEKIKNKRFEYVDEQLRHPNSLSSQEDRKERLNTRTDLDKLRLTRLSRCLEDENIDDYKFVEFVNKCSAFGIPNDVMEYTIKRSNELENEYLSAVKIANQYLNSLYGELTYKETDL